MKIPQTIHHKKNEIQEVEFFKDKECTEAFDILTTNVKNLYIEPVNGDVTPIITLDANPFKIKVYTGYCPIMGLATTLDDITPNLSKYIPKDNAVLFLSEESGRHYGKMFKLNWFYHFTEDYYETAIECQFINQSSVSEGVKEGEEILLEEFYNLPKNKIPSKKLTIFLPHGTQSELQKAEEFGKYLWENFRIKPNLYVLHCFNENLQNYTGEICAIKFKKDIRFSDYKLVKVNHAMAEIANNLHQYLYAYNVTKSEGIISRFEEFAEDSLESYGKLEELRMQFGENFTIIPNHIKTKALNDIKKSLEKYKTDLGTHNSCQLKYSERKSFFSEDLYFDKEGIFNKIITTNSTGILKPENSTERLQIIDAKEIFEEYLNENNLI